MNNNFQSKIKRHKPFWLLYKIILTKIKNNFTKIMRITFYKVYDDNDIFY